MHDPGKGELMVTIRRPSAVLAGLFFSGLVGILAATSMPAQESAAPAGRGFGPPSGGDLPATQQLIAGGWGYAYLNPGSVQADNGAGLTKGIIGLVNKGQPRKPDDWGSLRAWAWGASRGLDYLETDKAVDAHELITLWLAASDLHQLWSP